MGTLLRQGFIFTRLEGIRAAYSAAFDEQSSKIDMALADKSIDALSIVRNVLVHRAAIADKEYEDKCKSVQAIPQLRVGERFPINGAIIGNITGPAILKSMELIEAVDRWIESHPIKTDAR